MTTPTAQLQLTWTPATGSPVDLNDPAAGYQILGALVGTAMPDIDLKLRQSQNDAGEWLESVRVRSRVIDVPFATLSDTGVMQAQSRLRTLARALSPLRPEGTLRLTFADGSARELRARYEAGLQGATLSLTDDGGDEWISAVLSFRCLDPFWTDTQDTVLTARTTGTRAFFPMFADPDDVGPHLDSSSVFAAMNITNNGDVNAWPVVRIDGPASDLIVNNVTTGAKIDLSNNGGIGLAAGEWLEVDTHPGVKTVTRFDGLNLFSKMTDDSDLWPLVVGAQQVNVVANGADARSLVTVSFRNRYLVA